MKFEIEETTITTIIRHIEAENANEAEQKSMNDSNTIMRKKEQISKEIRQFVKTAVTPPERKGNPITFQRPNPSAKPPLLQR